MRCGTWEKSCLLRLFRNLQPMATYTAGQVKAPGRDEVPLSGGTLGVYHSGTAPVVQLWQPATQPGTSINFLLPGCKALSVTELHKRASSTTCSSSREAVAIGMGHVKQMAVLLVESAYLSQLRAGHLRFAGGGHLEGVREPDGGAAGGGGRRRLRHHHGHPAAPGAGAGVLSLPLFLHLPL